MCYLAKSFKEVLQLSMTAREIEFDPEKAILNLQVHKVSFEDAALVFGDPLRIERRDDSDWEHIR
jgi:uncharacterized DUF497 family protein